MINDIVHYCIG